MLPTELNILFVGELLAFLDYLQVFWFWPPEQPVNGFQIDYREVNTNEWSTLYAAPDDRMATIMDLTANEIYEIRIIALTVSTTQIPVTTTALTTKGIYYRILFKQLS